MDKGPRHGQKLPRQRWQYLTVPIPMKIFRSIQVPACLRSPMSICSRSCGRFKRNRAGCESSSQPSGRSERSPNGASVQRWRSCRDARPKLVSHAHLIRGCQRCWFSFVSESFVSAAQKSCKGSVSNGQCRQLASLPIWNDWRPNGTPFPSETDPYPAVLTSLVSLE